MSRNFFVLNPSRRFISLLSRLWHGTKDNTLTPKYSEQQLIDALKSKFPKARAINVKDISGGCGAMYEIFVESTEFKEISIVKQHKMITDTLKNEIKDMHGLRIHTAIPDNN